jgi:hypothetical protein
LLAAKANGNRRRDGMISASVVLGTDEEGPLLTKDRYA